MEMRQSKITRKLRIILITVVFLVTTIPVLAQSGGDYDLSWNTIDSGGYTYSSGGVYSVGGTIGQLDAGIMSGGVYTLSGGFWAGYQVIEQRIYLPLILR